MKTVRYIILVWAVSLCPKAGAAESPGLGSPGTQAIPGARSSTNVPGAPWNAYSTDWTVDSTTICTLLDEARRQPRTINYPLFFARKFLGRPYVAHTLDINTEEQLVVNTRQLDCTTLVENVTALTLCARRNLYTWRGFLNALVSMRYRGGQIDGYASRIHYFTEWITANSAAGIVTELQGPNPPFSSLQTVRVSYMSRHPESYAALRQNRALVEEIRRMEQYVTGGSFRFIPKAAVKNTKALRRAVRNGDIIAITSRKAGIDIAHLGFAVWRNDGLHLLNASSIHHKVVEEPMTLYSYLQKHSTHTGVRIVRINR